MSTCLLCSKPAENTVLCDGCAVALAGRLERLPGLSARLPAALPPAARGGAERVTAGRPGPSAPVNEAALELWYGGMATILERWRADIQAWRGWGEPAVEGNVDRRVHVAARWIGMSLDWIAADYPLAADMAREVSALEGAALSILGEKEDRGRRIGTCIASLADGGTCGGVLRHMPGETTVLCPWCTYEYGPRDWLTLRDLQPTEDTTPTPERTAS